MKDAYLVSITLILIKEENKMDDKNINGIMIFNLDTQDYYYTNRPLDLFPNYKYSFEKYANYIKEK